MTKKFTSKRTLSERESNKRKARRLQRESEGRKPLAEALTIAFPEELGRAIKRNELIFFDGKTRISLPLSRRFLGKSNDLQGLYKIDENKYISFRSSIEEGFGVKLPMINFYSVELIGKTVLELPLKSNFVTRGRELAHMKIEDELRGRGLVLKALSKTEREARSIAESNGLIHFTSNPMFQEIFEKLGFKKAGEMKNPVEPEKSRVILMKKAKPNPEDNMAKYHRIEAIDPKTGKAGMFTFEIK